MKLENDQGWIKIEFVCYAPDSVCRSSNLTDEKNCVEIDFNFDITGSGWGCVGDEYFITSDIQELSNGFQNILCNNRDKFIYSGNYPYLSLSPNPFYTFFVERKNDEIKIKLKIHDRLDAYVSVEQLMPIDDFKKIADEFLEATKKFPVRN